MKINICYICIGVSTIWLLLSAGVAWGYLSPATFIVPIALLMGSTVAGLAYVGEKRFYWAGQNPQIWKVIIISIGMPLAFIMVTNLTRLTVLIELISLVLIAIIFFIRWPSSTAGGSNKISKIEELIDSCC